MKLCSQMLVIFSSLYQCVQSASLEAKDTVEGTFAKRMLGDLSSQIEEMSLPTVDISPENFSAKLDLIHAHEDPGNKRWSKYMKLLQTAKNQYGYALDQTSQYYREKQEEKEIDSRNISALINRIDEKNRALNIFIEKLNQLPDQHLMKKATFEAKTSDALGYCRHSFCIVDDVQKKLREYLYGKIATNKEGEAEKERVSKRLEKAKAKDVAWKAEDFNGMYHF